MSPDSLRELVVYKHHYTGRERSELGDYVEVDKDE